MRAYCQPGTIPGTGYEKVSKRQRSGPLELTAQIARH